jgi:uridine kinase
MSVDTVRARIDALWGRERILVAIDGSCAAGKTTLAAALAEHYDCNVFHMDDFFLRPQQRTPERYAEIGGNVDYERFRQEVLLPLLAGDAFSYRPFDCRTMALTEPVAVSPRQLNIVEGAYSMHPFFGDPYDLKIFLTVTPEVRRSRILERPAHLHQPFFERWIPMEQRYFDAFAIESGCDMVISG